MSLTILCHDPIIDIIHVEVKAKASNIEICLVPHNIQFGKDTNKSLMPTVAIQVDRKYVANQKGCLPQ